MVRRVSSRTSARRAWASRASSTAGSGISANTAAEVSLVLPPDGVAPAGVTVKVPCTMFIAQENPNSPARSGVSSTVVWVNAGSARLTPRSGKTTRLVQSPVSCRSKVIRSGTPATASIRAGL